ncbi:MAG: glycoside hydrolase family 16 protein [Fibrobacterales bacterium]
MTRNYILSLCLTGILFGCSTDIQNQTDETSSSDTDESSVSILSSEDENTSSTESSEGTESSSENVSSAESSEEESSTESSSMVSSSNSEDSSSSRTESSSSEELSSSSSTPTDPYAFDPEEFPKYEGFTLKIAEEFNGSPANPLIWKSGDGSWDGNLCRFGPGGIAYSDSSMFLKVTEQFVAESFSNTEDQNVGDRDYLCGELATKKMLFTYGRLEGRFRGPQGSGWVTSLFWFHFPKSHWRELDVEIEGQYHNSYKTNIWKTDGTQNSRSESPTDYEIHNFNVYSMEWGPGYAKFFTNGELTREIYGNDENDTEWVPNEPLALLANFWIGSYGEGFGGPNDGNTYPMKAEYDWIRYYELDTHPNNWEEILSE